MVTTLTGENAYAVQRELQAIVTMFLADHDAFGIEQLDGEEADFARLHEALVSLPFLADKKLVILRRPSANKEFTEAAEALLSDVPESTDVVILEPKLDKRLSYYKFLKKQTDFREFPELDVRALAAWLVETAEAGNGKLSRADAQYLVERVGANQQLLANELEKLLLYAPNITRASIDTLSEATPQSTIFSLLEAAFAGRSAQALKLYHEQRQLKVEPPQVIAMLSWQLHILALIKTAGDRPASTIASEAKLSPYVVQKSQAIARRLSLARLRTLIADLLSIDARSKRQSLNLDDALQNYLLTLAA